MDLAAADRPARDQIGSIAHTWQSWKCPCSGCTKARKNEREYCIQVIQSKISSADAGTQSVLNEIIEIIQS